MTQRQQQVAQNVTSRYLKKASLQQLLEKIFPGHTDFEIEVCMPRLALPRRGVRSIENEIY
ncbi:hypothetical protein CABS03_01487 [Colletotrichum abscissum]|uniref:Uncharacterized protein n=1 Tax=Colletotrichum abscissum TaxID=1671311 RepID=A0A9P9XDL8_9PEZI|nr:hypothetical protein CABS02_07315 [Colletotrichum abscissum]